MHSITAMLPVLTEKQLLSGLLCWPLTNCPPARCMHPPHTLTCCGQVSPRFDSTRICCQLHSAGTGAATVNVTSMSHHYDTIMILPNETQCAAWLWFSHVIMMFMYCRSRFNHVALQLTVKPVTLVGPIGMHKIGCSGDARLVLHVPSSS